MVEDGDGSWPDFAARRELEFGTDVMLEAMCSVYGVPFSAA
jgi:hypothetical protein